jgi:thiol-disulfide isomerase/thioredoxin
MIHGRGRAPGGICRCARLWGTYAVFVVLFLVVSLLPKQALAFENLSREKLDVLLQSNQGKVTMVSYWTTWCGYCREEIPELKKIRDDYSKDDLAMIGISLDTNMAQLKTFSKMARFNYDIYHVAEKNKFQFNEIDSLPTLVFYKKNGKKGWTQRGYMTPEQIRKTITHFIKEQ